MAMPSRMAVQRGSHMVEGLAVQLHLASLEAYSQAQPLPNRIAQPAGEVIFASQESYLRLCM